MKVNFSDFLNLNLHDLAKGFIVAIVMAVLGSLVPIIESGRFPSWVEFKTIGLGSLLAGIAYLLKNLFSPQPGTVVIDRSKTDVEFKK